MSGDTFLAWCEECGEETEHNADGGACNNDLGECPCGEPLHPVASEADDGRFLCDDCYEEEEYHAAEERAARQQKAPQPDAPDPAA